MKYVCRQVNPEYQESPMKHYREISEGYEGLFLIPAEHCYGINNEEVKELKNTMYEIIDEMEGETNYYNNVTECVNSLMPKENGKNYSSREIHAFKEIAKDFNEDDTKTICNLIALVYGGEWDWRPIHGCCQGDYAEVIFRTDMWDEKSIDCIEIEYFNLGTEWVCDLEGVNDNEEITEDSIGDAVWVYAYEWQDEKIKEELADAIGCNADNIVMFKYTGCTKISTYERV